MSNIYDVCYDHGGMTGYVWEDDPKRVAFTLARYKFVAKMFEGYGSVTELGCSDGFGGRIVRQHVDYYTGVDCDEKAIRRAKQGVSTRWAMNFVCADFFKLDYDACDGVFALDVFEHIAAKLTNKFLRIMRDAAPVAIIGTPSLESQQYASELSKRGHVNCLTGDEFKLTLNKTWRRVFLFSMNDEVVHTGFNKMAHYLLALCVR